MTKEELKQEAQRSFDELDDWGIGDDWSIEESYKNGYSNGAEPREKRIAELEAQIEKMKRCFNCKYRNKFVESKCGECECYSKWEIVEND